MHQKKPGWYVLLSSVFAIFGVHAGFPVTAGERRPAEPFLEQQILFSAGDHGYTRFRIPALAISNTGTVLSFAEARKGEGHDWSEVDLVLRRSFDHGQTWEELQTIADDGENTMGNPCPVLDRDTGTLWLTFCKNNRQVFVTNSTDEGLHWSPVREITASVTNPDWSYLGTGPGHGIQLKSGRLLIPCWGDSTPGPRDWPPTQWGLFQFSYVFFSDDHGLTWQKGETLTHDLSDECAAVETTDGKLYLNMRSRQDKRCRASAWSNDGGRTWSDVEFDVRLPEPSCQAGLARFTRSPEFDRNRVLLSHPASTTDRRQLTLRLSYDECRTWPVAKVLNEGTSAYSDLVTAANLTILCLYESDQARNLSSDNAITLARLNLEWLTDGKDSP